MAVLSKVIYLFSIIVLLTNAHIFGAARAPKNALSTGVATEDTATMAQLQKKVTQLIQNAYAEDQCFYSNKTKSLVFVPKNIAEQLKKINKKIKETQEKMTRSLDYEGDWPSLFKKFIMLNKARELIILQHAKSPESTN